MSSPQSTLSPEQIRANVVAVIENYCGFAPLNSSAPLRETIVHSLTFLQVIMDIEEPVSYTHLTLPTSDLV